MRFPVKVEQDVVPKVVLLAPTQAELRLRPDEQVRLEYEVSEDFGLDAAAVDLLVNGSTVDPLPAAVPEQDTLSAKPIWRGEELVSIGALTEKYKNADELRMAVAVTDNLPESLGGPNVGRSEWLIIKIDRNAESLARQEIRARVASFGFPAAASRERRRPRTAGSGERSQGRSGIISLRGD